MTNEKEEIDFELRQVDRIDAPVPEKEEIMEDEQYEVDYVQAYAAPDETGAWKVHIVVVWEGDTNEIILSANDAKALVGGVAVANSTIMRERAKEKFSRKKTPKTA